jgi:hypothetical protein
MLVLPASANILFTLSTVVKSTVSAVVVERPSAGFCVLSVYYVLRKLDMVGRYVSWRQGGAL